MRPRVGGLLLCALLAAWLTPLAGWLGGNPPVTARTQLQFYRGLAAALRTEPQLAIYTDDWHAYLWTQVLAGETPRLVLLRQAPDGPGYLEVFLNGLVLYQEQSDTYPCTRPGLYLIRDVTRCRPLPINMPETATGNALAFFRVPDGGQATP